MKAKNSVLRTLFNGLFMGVADAIPGVSGATIALILGIYERLIHSLSFFFSNIRNPKKLLKSNELKFLVNLYCGVVIAYYLSLKIIKELLKSHEIPLFSYFVGLIIASILLIISKNRKVVLNKLLFMFLGFLFGAFFLSKNLIIQNHSNIMIFLSGVAAISAMILPGISGSYVLLMLNQYDFIATGIVDFNLTIISIFAVGIILGIFFMSKILNWLLEKHHDATLTFLIGLMIGGLRTPLRRIDGDYKSFLIFGFLGIITVLIISLLQRKKENESKR